MKKFLILLFMMSFGIILGSSQAVGTKQVDDVISANQSATDSNKADDVSKSKILPGVKVSVVKREDEVSSPDKKRSRVEIPCEMKREMMTEKVGKANSLCDLGKRYFCGIGVLINRERAKTYFEQAEKLGSERASVYLGLCYFLGLSGVKNVEKAEEYFKKSMPFILDQVEKGNAEYECFLGLMKEHGLAGQSQNISEAIELYRKAAVKGNEDAQCNLGLCYHIGKGVPRNRYIAMVWYEKAILFGNVTAQYNLGCCYEDMKNYTMAVKWFRLAADRGNAKAQNSLGEYYERGRALPKSCSEAVVWYKKAAEQGDTRAWFNLIMLLGLRHRH